MYIVFTHYLMPLVLVVLTCIVLRAIVDMVKLDKGLDRNTFSNCTMEQAIGHTLGFLSMYGVYSYLWSLLFIAEVGIVLLSIIFIVLCLALFTIYVLCTC